MMTMNEHTVFLWDGVGALLSALLLGLVLPAIHPLIGMPVPILSLLSALALLYAVYDFSCLRWVDKHDPKWLGVVIFANLFHVIVTVIYLWIYASEIKPLGFTYFVGEILVVLVIVFYELKIVRSLVDAVRSQ
jgi:hypothetical protein